MTEQKAGREAAVFDDFRKLTPEVQKHLLTLEAFIGDVDGKEICSEGSENTVVLEGVIDADDAVRAINALAAMLAPADGRDTGVQPGWLARDIKQASERIADNFGSRSARDAGLEEAANWCGAQAFAARCADDTMKGVHDAAPYEKMSAAIRALKSSPAPSPSPNIVKALEEARSRLIDAVDFIATTFGPLNHHNDQTLWKNEEAFNIWQAHVSGIVDLNAALASLKGAKP